MKDFKEGHPKEIEMKVTRDYKKEYDEHKEHIRQLWKKAQFKAKAITNLNKLSHEISQKVYGIDDHIVDAEIKHNKWLIMPNNKFKKFWNIFMIHFMIYTITYLPYRICFLEQKSEDMDNYEIFMQICFGIDIFLTFFTAYYNKYDVLITSKIDIALSYLKSWFIIDFLACFPFSSIIESYNSDNEKENYAQLLRISRLNKLYRLFRIIINFKNIKYFRRFKFVNYFTASTRRMIKTMMVCLIFVHLSACFYFLIAKLDNFSPNSWIYVQNLQDEEPENQYLNAFYWSMQTVTTVGFGDITPVSDIERIYVIIWMAFGGAYYSFVISNLGEELENRENENTLKAKLSAFKIFTNETNLPPNLVQKIKKFYQFYYKEFGYHNISKENFIEELPYTLKAQLMLTIHVKIIARVPFFMGREIGLILSVVPNLKPLSYEQGDLIYSEDEYAEQLYFMNIGVVNFKTVEGNIFKTINSGDMFGEIEVIYKEKRLNNAEAWQRSLIFSLDKEIFYKMMEDYPNVSVEISSKSENKRKELLITKKNAETSKNANCSTIIYTGTKEKPIKVQNPMSLKAPLKMRKKSEEETKNVKFTNQFSFRSMDSFSSSFSGSFHKSFSTQDGVNDKKTILKLTQDELDKKVNKLMVEYYDKFMKTIPLLMKESEEIYSQAEKKEEEHQLYLKQIEEIKEIFLKIEAKQTHIKSILNEI